MCGSEQVVKKQEFCGETSTSSVNSGSRWNLYWDEEEVFNMPNLINSMAEGLVMTPPALTTGFNWLPMETATDLTLWLHSQRNLFIYTPLAHLITNLSLNAYFISFSPFLRLKSIFVLVIYIYNISV